MKNRIVQYVLKNINFIKKLYCKNKYNAMYGVKKL